MAFEMKERYSRNIPAVSPEDMEKLRQSSVLVAGCGGLGGLVIEATVHGGPKTYPLAHLLENGHAKRGGGRTAPIVHIKPVEEWAIEEVQKTIKEEVERL